MPPCSNLTVTFEPYGEILHDRSVWNSHATSQIIKWKQIF